jgi:Transposase IS200 like
LWFASKNVRNGLVFDTKGGQQVQPFVGTTFSRPQHLVSPPTAPVGATASDSMGRTYTSLTYHLIFSTKYRLKTIRPEFRERLYQYIGAIIREKEGVLLEIGGIEIMFISWQEFPRRFLFQTC